MFTTLIDDLKLFVEERDWMQYHSPQNMATTLIVEATEMLEHFLPGAPQAPKELKNELGDLLHCILLTMDALQLEIPSKLINYKPSSPLFIELSKKLQTFMGHFLWLRKDEPYRGNLSDLQQTLNELLAIHFLICHELHIDPIEATFNKLEILRKKYPIELMKGTVDNYFARKKTLSQQEMQ